MSHGPESGGASSFGFLMQFIFCGFGEFVNSLGRLLEASSGHSH